MKVLLRMVSGLLLSVGFLFFSCKEAPINKKSDAIPEAAEHFLKLGFKAEDGRFLRYFCEGEYLFLEYGNKNFRRVMNDTFYCDEFYHGFEKNSLCVLCTTYL